MIKSMTGFGRGELEGRIIEIRSLNHRFTDITLRMSRNFSSLENRFKEEIKKKVKRGRIEVSCITESTRSSEGVKIILDESLADQIYQSLNRMKDLYGLQKEVTLADMTFFREIFKTEEVGVDLDTAWESILPSLTQALESLDEMRVREGEAIFQGLNESLGVLEALHQNLLERAPVVVEAYRERLQERMQEILPAEDLDRNRLIQEAALFSDRSDITEELTRLKSHLLQFRETMEAPGPNGRRMEFLLQELNREVNTVGAKGNDLSVSQWAVDAKGELEKMREQIQNVE